LILRKASAPDGAYSDNMRRDDTVAVLLGRRFATADSLKREAATVLIDLCRDGMSDAEIAVAMENAELRLPKELILEIRAVAEEIGISLN
jgi:hypothetical protein